MPFPWWYRAWLNYHFGLAASATRGATTPPRATTPRRHKLMVAYCVWEMHEDLEELSVEEVLELMRGD